MSAHVSSVYRSAYCFLPAPATSSRTIVMTSADAAKTVAHAFTSSHLDYCNSLLYVYGISDVLVWWLQAVKNAVTRLITGTR